MNINNSSTIRETVDEKLAGVISLSNSLRESLQDLRSAAIPHSLYDGITRLCTSLELLQKQVNELEEEKQRYKVLSQIGQVINSSLDVDVVLQIVMDTMIRLTGAERGFLMLRDAQQKLEIKIARNWEQEKVEQSDSAISRTIVSKVVDDGKPILTTNAQEDPRFRDQESIVTLNLRSILCVPLKARGEVIGVIYADNRIKSGLFTIADMDLLTSFASHAAVSIENARLFASVRQSLAEVTEIKNLMDNVFDSISNGVITLNKEKIITACNLSAASVLGKDRSEIIGVALREINQSLSDRIHGEVEQVIFENERYRELVKMIWLPGRGETELIFHLSPVRSYTMESEGVVIVFSNPEC